MDQDLQQHVTGDFGQVRPGRGGTWVGSRGHRPNIPGPVPAGPPTESTAGPTGTDSTDSTDNQTADTAGTVRPDR
ncbi:hypothetical protein ADK67_03485 [Saccharothrix sp. NRRL B-16348]|nr:hypothetical protein ADK67_03485 [Saccharothrix sp. NRRL B-16348]